MFGAGRPDQPPDDSSQYNDGEEPSHEPGDSGHPGGPARRLFGASPKVLTVAVAALAVALAGGAFALTSHTASASHGRPMRAAEPAYGPLRLVSVTPVAGATEVDGANPITVTFSDPVAGDTPLPTLQPAIPGHWAPVGDQLVFTPDTAFRPASQVSVTVPAGISGVHGAGGGLLEKTFTEHFSTGRYSQLRLAQMLGQLGYLPLTWSVAGSGTAQARLRSVTSDMPNMTQQSMAYDPPAGNFYWKPGYPPELHGLWSPASAGNVMVRGAIMAFQSQHAMSVDGKVTGGLWQALFKADEQVQVNPHGYTYAIASKGSPETLTIWHNGHVVLHSLANTGIPVAPTVDGSFPVYLRLRFQIMSGTNPDGSHYADPVSYVSYFNGGDAVHYFPRGSYGSEQSLGCVELPMTQAREAYPFLTYGSVVTVR